jgi:hypothetical protein
MENTPLELKELLLQLKDRFNMLVPIMLQMGIIEDLLNKKIIIDERGVASYTIAITSNGMTVEDGADPFSHAVMRTTGAEWHKILTGLKTYATIFRFELEPLRDAVPLKDMSLVERFSSVMQAMVLLKLG